MHCRYCGAEMTERETKCRVCGSTSKVEGCDSWGDKDARRPMILDGQKSSYRVHGHTEEGEGGSNFREYCLEDEQKKVSQKNIAQEIKELWHDKNAKGSRAVLKVLLFIVFFILYLFVEVFLEEIFN